MSALIKQALSFYLDQPKADIEDVKEISKEISQKLKELEKKIL